MVFIAGLGIAGIVAQLLGLSHAARLAILLPTLTCVVILLILQRKRETRS